VLHHVSGISFLLHCANLIPPLTPLSTSVISTASVPCYLSSSITPSFTPGLKPIFSTNHSHHRLFSHSLWVTPQLPDCFRYFWDFSFLAFSFLSLFFTYSTVQQIKLTTVSFWAHNKYSISYLILSYLPWHCRPSRVCVTASQLTVMRWTPRHSRSQNLTQHHHHWQQQNSNNSIATSITMCQ